METFTEQGKLHAPKGTKLTSKQCLETEQLPVRNQKSSKS